MLRHLGRWVGACFILALFLSAGCHSLVAPALASEGSISLTSTSDGNLASYGMTGDTQQLHDPSIIRQGSTYYVFSSDVIVPSPGNFLPIRCSQDQIKWSDCGGAFQSIPEWVKKKVPGVACLWAPDISYFGGLYHLYYAGSTSGSQRSVIGLATNTTLDATDPNYKWVDDGEVLESVPGNDFNAIDPNLAIDGTDRVWMMFGSYWSGLKQIQIDPLTGKPIAGAPILSLASRPGVANNPIEGASMVHHGSYYYLFASIDYCCNADSATNNYKEVFGRSSSPQGPFTDMNGHEMTSGGGTVLLRGLGIWQAPGGATAYVDSQTGESVLVFHALKTTENSASYLWLQRINWQNDWPVLQ
jgi:arabinan endo-1,5-alpha-L-arabinosidase